MGDKIRFGIIGGGMAGPLNAGALRDIPEAEVVAFCDVKELGVLEYRSVRFDTEVLDIPNFQPVYDDDAGRAGTSENGFPGS